MMTPKNLFSHPLVTRLVAQFHAECIPCRQNKSAPSQAVRIVLSCDGFVVSMLFFLVLLRSDS